MSKQVSTRGHSRFQAAVHATTRIFALLAVSCVVFVLLAVTADVFRRSLFGKSIGGVLEISEVMMVVIVFLGLGYAERRGAHVSMTLLIRKLPSRSAAVVNSVGLLVVLVVVGWMVWVTGDRALESVAAGEYRFGLVRIAVWPARIAIVLGLAAYFLELALRLSDNIRAMRVKGACQPSHDESVAEPPLV